MIYSIALGAALAYAAFQRGGVWVANWSVSLSIVSLVSLVYWLRTPSREIAPKPEWFLKWPVLILVLYPALQLVPLPLWVLDVVSPARASLLRDVVQVAPGIQYAPLSVTPTITLGHLLRFGGYGVVFFLVRELTWRSREHPWRVSVPIIVVAAAEGALGMAQHFLGANVSGTYVNRNHFAGLLEMALPLAAVFAFTLFHRTMSNRDTPAGSIVLGGLSLACAGVILAGVLYSYSRMGFISSLLGLLVAGVLAVGVSFKRRTQYAAGAAVVGAAAMGFVFLPLDTLIYRFGELADENGISSDTRLELWKETQDVIRAYPALGCGLGGYQSAFEKHQRVALLNLMDYAHNDYLQFLAETGWFGFAVMMAFIAGVAVKASRALQPERSLAERHLGMALIGAMSAIAAHSLADFNLYIPANAMTLVWMGGMAAGLTPRLG